MSRIDRDCLRRAVFPVEMDVQTRFADLDVQGHINNAAGVVLLQEARVALNRTAGVTSLSDELRMMVASLTVEYAGELHHPGAIAIGTGILAIGRTSFTVAQIARQDGVARLFAQIVMVVTDAAGPIPIPGPLRTAYERLTIA